MMVDSKTLHVLVKVTSLTGMCCTHIHHPTTFCEVGVGVLKKLSPTTPCRGCTAVARTVAIQRPGRGSSGNLGDLRGKNGSLV